MSPNQWHHVAFTFDGTNLRVYQDGFQTGSTTFTATTAKAGARNLQLGRHIDCLFGSCYTFHGLIDEVGIYNRALSAAEIKAIFDAGSAGKVKPTPPAGT